MLPMLRRTSHEVRGLKSDNVRVMLRLRQSHLTRGAWIEMIAASQRRRLTRSRTSHEVRGLK